MAAARNCVAKADNFGVRNSAAMKTGRRPPGAIQRCTRACQGERRHYAGALVLSSLRGAAMRRHSRGPGSAGGDPRAAPTKPAEAAAAAAGREKAIKTAAGAAKCELSVRKPASMRQIACISWRIS